MAGWDSLSAVTAMVRVMADDFIECYAILQESDLTSEEKADAEAGLKNATDFFESQLFLAYCETVLKGGCVRFSSTDYGMLAVEGLKKQALAGGMSRRYTRG